MIFLFVSFVHFSIGVFIILLIACEIKKKPYPLYDSFQTFCFSFNLVYDMFCYMENFYFYVVKSVNLFIMVYAFHIMPQKASGTMRL